MKHAFRTTAIVLCFVALGLMGGFRAIAFGVLTVIAFVFFVLSGASGETPAPRHRSARLRVWLPNREYSEGAVLMRVYTNRKYPITFTAVDADGVAATIDGAASFTVDPPEAGAFRSPNPEAPDETGFDPKVTQILEINRAYVETHGVPTGIVIAQITATGDADRGDGVRTLVASGAFEFALPEATAAELVVGDGLPLSA